MKISVKKIDGVLVPVGEEAAEQFKKLTKTEFVVSIASNRNPAFHRKAFALLNRIYSNQEKFDNVDLFRAWITMKAGYVLTGTAPNGTPLFLPESLSFESMKPEKFERWYSSVLDVAFYEYGMDKDALNMLMDFT